MIVDVFLKIIGWFFIILWSPLALIPDGTFIIDKLADAIYFILRYTHGWDWILPISDALLMLKLSIFISFGLSIYYSVLLLIRIIRGS